jgi:oligosaccharyltransferase complex subunit beta
VLIIIGLGPNLLPQTLLKFINAEGNILLTLSSSNPTPSALVSLLLELDIHLPTDRNSIVVDHFNYDSLSSPESHDVLLLPRPSAVRPDVRNFFSGKNKDEVIAFPHGVGQTLGNDSPYLTPVLRAPSTAYSYNPKEEVESVEDPFAVGQQLSLVTTMQARNSARFTVLGAAEMLEDKWFKGKVQNAGSKATTGANEAFAKDISGWTFNEIGVLKVNSVTHFLNEEGLKTPNASLINPKIYRVKNTVVRKFP